MSYYIDFDSGLDSNNGTSTSTPWKHCPGDPNATGNAAACVLVAGDVVNFKGGVYRGQIVCNRSGASGSPITYKTGAGWGTGAAVIDGADVWSSTWTQCTSAAECGGNANYANLWWATVPSDFSILVPLYEDGEFVWFSESPFPVNPVIYDNYPEFHEIPQGDPVKSISRTSVTDPSVFNQTDSAYWNGDYVLVWGTGNSVYLREITTYDPATGTITFADISVDVYTDRSNRYAVLGHAGIISGAGQVGVYDGKVFVWPINSDNPNDHAYSYSTRKYAFDLGNDCQYVNISGFEIRGFWASENDSQTGSAVRNLSGRTASYIEISNNEIKYLRSMVRSAAVFFYDGQNIKIENNNIHDCQKNVGLLCIGDRIYVDNNTIDNVGGTGISFMRATNSRIVGNTLSRITGSHANGISVYDSSKDILVFNNWVRIGNGNYCLTYQQSENVYTIGNFLDGIEESKVVADWGSPPGMTGVNPFLYNTVVRANSNFSVMIGSTTNPFVFRNNILDGLAGKTSADIPSDRQHNLYVDYSWQQNADSFSLGSGEIYNTDSASIFTDPSNGSFTLKAGSPAIGAGVDVSAYYPTTVFPDIDFTKDLTGATRSGFDLGAYEYATGGGVNEDPDPEDPTTGWLPLGTASGILVLGVTA